MESHSPTPNQAALENKSLDVLIVGSGGREHALAWKIAQSPKAGRIFVAPGNGGTALLDKAENLAIDADNVEGLVGFALNQHITLCIIGPEAPLAAGLRDRMDDANILCIGPTQAAARLESSKAFCKDFLNRHLIPTAAFASFSEIGEALLHIKTTSGPWVIKADGLAAGKGVVICTDREKAKHTLQQMMKDNKFGEAGQKVVIEDFLQGEEASFIYLVDRGRIVPLASSQDHKARDEGDQGPNTGGMGAYSPAILPSGLEERVLEEIIRPTILGLAQENTPFSGFLYAGIMISPEGDPKVLEFNCRLGDPETQPILMRLKSDLLDAVLKMAQGNLQDVSLEWDTRSALGVVMAAGGYPESYDKGKTIYGLEKSTGKNIAIFHAGTRLVPKAEDENPGNGNINSDKNATSSLKTNGGRVLCVCALGDDLEKAQKLAYSACEQIHWENAYYRKDIGFKGINKLKTPDFENFEMIDTQ